MLDARRLAAAVVMRGENRSRIAGTIILGSQAGACPLMITIIAGHKRHRCAPPWRSPARCIRAAALGR